MYDYPEVVAKIAADYLQRLKSHLHMVPAHEQTEFLKEIQSHIYEAYQNETDGDDVQRILTVLRKLGEPAEVVADRLPQAMVRSGTKRNFPLYVVGGILLALFGIPLGFAGIGVLVGALGALAGILIAYYATAGGAVLMGATGIVLGVSRIYQPELFDRLVAIGVIQLDSQVAQILDIFSPASQGSIMILVGLAFAGSGFGMLWLGRYLFRGLRFLFALVLEWIRQLFGKVRRLMRERKQEAFHFRNAEFKGGH
jgi:uncharacterized membrane protein